MRRHPQFLAYLALGAVCIFWGTTYLGIRMALEMFPPAMLLCIRYTLSGSILIGATLAFGVQLPSGRELWWTALFGAITIGIGNGALVWAELTVPSGLASLFVTLAPFWLVGFEALVPGGERLRSPVIGGLIVGLAGTLLLVAPSARQDGLNGPLLKGFLLLQLGCCGWSIGSILQRRCATTAHPVVSGAIQQLACGLVYVVPALFVKTESIRWSSRGVGALLYLVVFGSIVGYSAYAYALKFLPVSVVTVYNYVNPVIALFLGWFFYREHIGVQELLAMMVIFAGVAVVKRYGSHPTPQPQIRAVPPLVSHDGESRGTVV